MLDLFGNEDELIARHETTGLGSLADFDHAGLPLAVRMRPRTLDEIVGQKHLLAPGSPLRRLAESTTAMSVFLWGPPGVGKTTIASVVSHQQGRRFVEISAVTAGVKEVRTQLDIAQRELARGNPTVLFVDEVHRFNKAQQDVLLPAVENRLITLIAATTENPSFSVISPLLSRSLILTLQPLEKADLEILVERALTSERGLAGKFRLEDDAKAAILQLAGGDARRVLTYLEEAARSAEASNQEVIDLGAVEKSVDRAAVRYDADGDQHYDVISAFIKSVRGSDVDAALHYLARMIEAGEDPRFIARRLIILASEDIGMAAPNILPLCVSAAQAVALIGMPEARLTLAHAVIAAATAPKSNAVIKAISAAQADIKQGKIGLVPPHLRDAHYSSAKKYGHGVDYRYAHEFPNGIASQQYLPDELVGTHYYEPTKYGYEAEISQRLGFIRSQLNNDKKRSAE